MNGVEIIARIANLILNKINVSNIFEFNIAKSSALTWIEKDITYYFQKAIENKKYDSIFILSINSVWIRCTYDLLVKDKWVRKMKNQNRISCFHVKIRWIQNEDLYVITSKCTKYICENNLYRNDSIIKLYGLMVIIASWMIYDNVCPINTLHPFIATSTDSNNVKIKKQLKISGKKSASRLFAFTKPSLNVLVNRNDLLWINEQLLIQLWHKGSLSELPPNIELNKKDLRLDSLTNLEQQFKLAKNDLTEFNKLVKEERLLELEQHDVNKQLADEIDKSFKHYESNSGYNNHIETITILYAKANIVNQNICNTTYNINNILNQIGIRDINEAKLYLQNKVDTIYNAINELQKYSGEIEELKIKYKEIGEILYKTNDIMNEDKNDKIIHDLTIINDKIKTINSAINN